MPKETPGFTEADIKWRRDNEADFESDLSLFTNAYIEALYFAETGEIEHGQPASDLPLSGFARRDIEADCRVFWGRWHCLIRQADRTPMQAGHDFLLTRQGHGAGFWEQPDWPESLGERLTKSAKSFGEFFIYDNGENEIGIDG